jgi:hypothetical protein
MSIESAIGNNSTSCQDGSCYQWDIQYATRNSVYLYQTVSKLGSLKQCEVITKVLKRYYVM